MEKTLDTNQPREQAGFRKGFATTDHLHTISQIIEKAMNLTSLCASHILTMKKPLTQLSMK